MQLDTQEVYSVMADSIAPLGITNVYAPLSELKSRLSVQSSDYDGTMWQLLHVASRLIDRHCNRRFYVRTASRRFDVGDVSGFSVVDLISVNQIVEDWDGDGVYETTRSRSEYLLYPLDAEPESPHGCGFMRVRDNFKRSMRGFPIGRATVQVNARWGFRSHFINSGAALATGGAALNAASQSLTVTDGTNIDAGQTILMNNEQMFVRQIAARVVNVVRGLNGTVAVSHPNSTAIKVLQYPAEITEATLLTAVDRWRRRDGFMGGALLSDGSDLYSADSDISKLLAPYRRISM